MQITLSGLRSVTIQRNGAVGSATILIDPEVGGKPAKDVAAVLVSHPDEAAAVAKIFTDAFVIAGPGEYEIKDVLVRGVASDDGRILYALEDDGITFGYLSDSNQAEINDDQLDMLGTIDVLFVPVGGQTTLDAKRAMHLIQEIEPRLVIPIMHSVAGYDSVEVFARGFGSAVERTDKLKLTKKDLPTSEMKLVVLE